MRHLLTFLLWSGVSFLLAFSVAAQSQTGSTAGNASAENGKRIFIKKGCYECHGYDGHGGPGARLAPNPPALPALIAYVRHPAPGGMPVYSSKVLSDAELNDVWSYLKSIPQPPPVKDIPVLRQ